MSKFSEAVKTNLNLTGSELAQLGASSIIPNRPSWMPNWVPSLPSAATVTLKDIRTTEQISDATKKALPILTAEVKSAPVDKRFATLKAELQDVDTAKAALEAIEKVRNGVPQSFANAIAESKEFGIFITGKLQEDPNGLTKALGGDLAPEAANQLSIILDKIAIDGQSGKNEYNFENLDKMLNAATEHAEKTKDLELAKKNGIDTTATQKAADKAAKALLLATKEAGGNIPAMANINMPMMMTFLGNMFSVGPTMALDILGADLGMNPQELQALQATMGPIMNIIAPIMKPYADIYAKHGTSVEQDIMKIVKHGEILANGTPNPEYNANAGDLKIEVARTDDIAFQRFMNKAVPDNGAKIINGEAKIRQLFKAAGDASPTTREELEAIQNDPNLRSKFAEMVTGQTNEQAIAIVSDVMNKLEKGNGRTIGQAFGVT